RGHSTLRREREGMAHKRPGGKMQPVDAAFSARETHRVRSGKYETHDLHDECAVVWRFPCEERIGRAAVVIEGPLAALRVHDTEHPIESGGEHVSLQAGDERLPLL